MDSHLGIVKCEDSLEQDNIDLIGVHGSVFIHDPGVEFEVVDGNVRHLSLDDVGQTFLHEFIVKCV